MSRRFGPEAWSTLVSDMAKLYPCFRAPLVASSLVPWRDFLAFHDELVRRFFGGDARIYHRLGEESAQWALTKGPYKKFLARKDVRDFVDAIPQLCTAYWESPSMVYRAALQDGVVELEVVGLPQWHPYFEYLVVGYIKAALVLLSGDPVTVEQRRGGSGTEYRYEFRLPPPNATAAGGR
ncbi:MAG: hypothetical protein JOZ69_22075 [Myxococcales bacterium]|nr:hypothetical protein [Myxococcales bacterium]